MIIKKIKLGRYFFDFVSVFFAVVAAFSLDNWNTNRKDRIAEEKILMEIRNGLFLDLKDINENREGHMMSLRACASFEKVFKGDTIAQDSVKTHYGTLTIGATSTMNIAGYESLKSKGLEIIQNDSLRLKIIELYSLQYKNLEKFEEESPELQPFQNYFMPINEVISPYLNYESDGNISGLNQPVILPEKTKKLMLSYIWQIRIIRSSMFHEYEETEVKINNLLKHINKELDD
ncbi:hypothetical protein ZORO111903_03660 [Zobellia roscoffensis]|uniref:hypothetical protein n=1 Tax=Zobellia roscoffensis TaxID=2779508 RepID=UPI00188AC3F5|nr:hypothetical protein [Zobellia roscoffensis]